MAVDDLLWVDELSLRWLFYLWRRLEGLPVLIAASTRPPRREHAPLLAELLTVDRVEACVLGRSASLPVAR